MGVVMDIAALTDYSNGLCLSWGMGACAEGRHALAVLQCCRHLVTLYLFHLPPTTP
jgi:hypothetical protein